MGIEEYALAQIGELISGTGASFQIEDVRKFSGPIVYLLCSDDGPLYIGMSKQGLGRPFARTHRQMAKHIGLATSLKVYPCTSIQAARRAEKILIGLFQPKLNQTLKRELMRELLGAVNV